MGNERPSGMNARTLRALAAAAAIAGLCACGKISHPPGAATAQADNPASIDDGARIYITNCSSCHQLDGHGVPGVFPPLAANPIVTGNAQHVIAIVKRGQHATVRVAGHTYRGEMPAWDGLLNDTDIAAVVSYVRSAWNNRAPPVTQRDVRNAKNF